jgi:hypothetical protein
MDGRKRYREKSQTDTVSRRKISKIDVVTRPVKRITAVKYGIMSAHDVLEMSAVEITE